MHSANLCKLFQFIIYKPEIYRVDFRLKKRKKEIKRCTFYFFPASRHVSNNFIHLFGYFL